MFRIYEANEDHEVSDIFYTGILVSKYFLTELGFAGDFIVYVYQVFSCYRQFLTRREFQSGVKKQKAM